MHPTLVNVVLMYKIKFQTFHYFPNISLSNIIVDIVVDIVDVIVIIFVAFVDIVVIIFAVIVIIIIVIIIFVKPMSTF